MRKRSATAGGGPASGAAPTIARSSSVPGGFTSSASAASASAKLCGGAGGSSFAVPELAVGTDEAKYLGVACSTCALPTSSACGSLSEGANPPIPKGGVTPDVVISLVGDPRSLDSI